MNAPELVEFVQGLAERPQLWSHLIEHDRAARCYSELMCNDDVAAWLCTRKDTTPT